MPMSSKIVGVPEKDVENHPPSSPLSCTNNSNGLPVSNSPTVKRNSYLKQRGRRRWWYFNRGLQPISEVGESKDDTVKFENNDEDFSDFQDDSTVIENYSSTENSVISTSLPQNKEGYSACLKVIEKFQEVVIDSAVRVIQAAFKRFRERRRFLRIKKAVMVIQRNLRKWLETKHPCIRPSNFERQSSDGSKSDEYRESSENDFDGGVTDQVENSLTSTESEPGHSDCAKHNEITENDALVIQKDKGMDINEFMSQDVLDVEKSTLALENGDSEFKVNVNSENIKPKDNKCLTESEEESLESRSAEEAILGTFSNSKQEEIYSDVKSLLEELLVKVSRSFSSPDSCEVLHDKTEEPKDFENKEECTDNTGIGGPSNIVEKGFDYIKEQKDLSNKVKIELEQEELVNESKEHSQLTSDKLVENGLEKNILNEATKSPESLKDICHRCLDKFVLKGLSNMEKVGS